MTGIIDYGVGNLFSLQSSFAFLGEEAIVSGDAHTLSACERILLPGVGAFADAARKLRESGLDRFVADTASSGKPLLGICLGMQLLFEKSFEFGEHQGLGLLKGCIVPMHDSIPSGLKIPQMGWNALIIKHEHHLLRGIRDGDCVYFVHSFYAAGCEECLIATTEYGIEIPAVVGAGNIMGCQFHPEKSGEIGLKILKNFCEE